MSKLHKPTVTKDPGAAPGRPDEAGRAPGPSDPLELHRDLNLRGGCFAVIWLIWNVKSSWLIPIGLALVGWRFGLGSVLIGLAFLTLGMIVGGLGILRMVAEAGFARTLARDLEGQSRPSVDRQPKPALEGSEDGEWGEDLPPIESALHAGSALYPFASRFPKVAARETLAAKLEDAHPSMPNSAFVFTEYYCIDLDCDCRRVQIVVTDLDQPSETLATFGYGWGSISHYQKWAQDRATAELMQGVAIEPLAEQTELAGPLMESFAILLEDKRFVGGLRKHYRMMQEPVTKPSGRRRPAKRRRRPYP